MFTFTITLEDEYLLVESSGEMNTPEECMEYIEAQATRARQEGVLRLLVDDRNMTVCLDYSDILTIADHWEREGLQTLGLRVATLPPPCAPQAQQAFETTATNRSIVFKVFFDKGEALDWLLKR